MRIGYFTDTPRTAMTTSMLALYEELSPSLRIGAHAVR